MDWAESIAERKIQEAMREGAFDNLPDKGRPINFNDENGIPAELRIAYRILKNNGLVPPELEYRKEYTRLGDLIRCCQDENARKRYRQKQSLIRLKLEMALAKSGRALPGEYEDRAWEKLDRERET